MKVVWIVRSFLDYRIPVYRELSKRFNDNFYLLYNAEAVPVSVQEKIISVLGHRAIGLTGELKFEKVGYKGQKNTIQRIPYQPGLIAKIKELDPDLLISDGFFQWTYAALWMRAIYKTPHIMLYERTAHTERFASFLRITYRKIVMRWIDAIGCTGTLCSEYVKSLGYKKNIFYGHMVVDTEQLSRQCQTYDRTEDPLTILYVGRMVEEKGLFQLLEDWQKIEKKFNNVKLVLIGTGQDEDKLIEMAKKLSLESIHFMGRIEYDDLPRYYAQANLFIIPTLTDNWSLVVPEAMSCGLPILSSIYNGCYPELIQENGMTFDSLKSGDIYKSIKKMIDNKDKLPIMGERSKEMILEYSPHNAASEIYKVSQEITKERK